jgi:hypothetical protein
MFQIKYLRWHAKQLSRLNGRRPTLEEIVKMTVRPVRNSLWAKPGDLIDSIILRIAYQHTEHVRSLNNAPTETALGPFLMFFGRIFLVWPQVAPSWQRLKSDGDSNHDRLAA